MKSIIVLSDTHGNVKIYEKIMTQLQECDYIFHLGDFRKDAEVLEKLFPNKVTSVLGNCDGAFYKSEETVDVEEIKFFLTHGHSYSVKSGLESLTKRAKETGANVALYGHTHLFGDEKTDGVTLINPGTCSFISAQKTYLYINVVGSKFFYRIVPIY